MSRLLLVLLASVACVWACSGPQRPSGPPPEYERPQIEPWDTGAPVDPLENVEGEWVTDEPEPPGDAGIDAAAPEASAIDSDASASP